MHLKRKAMLWAAVFALALPLLLTGIAGAKYLSDGSTPNGTTGGWNLPADLGNCYTGTISGGAQLDVTLDPSQCRDTRDASVAAETSKTTCTTAGFKWQYGCADGTAGCCWPNWKFAGTYNGNDQCLRCHNTAYMNGHTPDPAPQAAKESYLKTGHKNMLRKVTAGQNWAGADGVIYTTDGTNSIDFSNATISLATSTCSDKVSPDQATCEAAGKTWTDSGARQLFYIYGDWMAVNPSVVYNRLNSDPNATNGYSCSPCHTTGFSNPTAGLCNDNTSTTQAACELAGSTWVASTGVTGTTGAEPYATYPGIKGITGYWDLNGINCSRCHASTYPVVSDGTTTLTSSHNNTPTGLAINNLCFGCHQSMAKVYPAGTQGSTDPTVIPVGANHGSTYGRDFNGHVLGNSFLNSPHARFRGVVAANKLGKFDIGAGTYDSKFEGGAGACTTCHDVHNSLFVVGQNGIKEECTGCHENNAASNAPQVDQAVLSHPKTAGTPWDTTLYGNDPCAVCHMATQAVTNGNQNSMPVHVWRINTNAAYSTFPSLDQWNATNGAAKDRNAQVSPETYTKADGSTGTYANAVWVDLDLACGQCHGGSLGVTANGAPVLTKDQLAAAAKTMHGDVSSMTNADCLTCHNVAQSGYDAVQQGVNHHNGACTECHGTAAWPLHQKVTTFMGDPVYNSTTRLDTAGTGCLACHDGRTGVAIQPASGFANIIPDGTGDNHHSDHGSCTTCHGPHGGLAPVTTAASGIYAGQTKSLAADGNDFCLCCHSNSGGYGKHHAVPALKAANKNCWDCHGTVDAPAGSYANAGVPGVAAPEDNAACLQCHGSNAFTSTTGANVRQVNQGANHHNGTCKTCHKAEMFTFLATGDLSTTGTATALQPMSNPTLTTKSGYVSIDTTIQTACLSCHSTPQTRSSDLVSLPAITQSGAGDNHHQGHAYIPGANGTDPGSYCLGCHGSIQVVSPVAGSTYSITASGLQPAVVSALKSMVSNTGNTPGNNAVSTLCVQCHSNVDHGHGSTVQEGPTKNHHSGDCLTCHVPDQLGGPGITSDAAGNPSKPSTIPSWVDCSFCHNKVNDGSQHGPGAGHHVEEPTQGLTYAACDSCHAYAGVKPSCSNCHTEAQPTIMQVSTTSGCEACHVTNAAGGAQAGVIPTITKACDKCHGGATSTTTANSAPYLDEPTLTSYGTNIHGTNPTAKFSWSNSTTADYTVLVDASNTTCPSGSCTYNWDFGDTSTGTGVTASHAYSGAGSYTVTLTVGTSTASAVVSPRYVGSTPTALTANVTMNGMTATADYTVTGGQSPYTVKITWGDGTTTSSSSATGPATHSYAAAGTYKGSVYAVDSGVNGSMKTSATVTFSATATMSTVTGTVYQSNGTTTVSGVYLYLMQGTTTKKIAVTSATGTYSFTNVPAGSYTIKAVKSGYTFGTPAASFTVSGNMTQNINSVTP